MHSKRLRWAFTPVRPTRQSQNLAEGTGTLQGPHPFSGKWLSASLGPRGISQSCWLENWAGVSSAGKALPCLEVRNIMRSAFVLVEEAVLRPGAARFPELSPAVLTACGGLSAECQSLLRGRVGRWVKAGMCGESPRDLPWPLSSPLPPPSGTQSACEGNQLHLHHHQLS